jgi:nucleoid DNA-binding protein
MIKSELAQRLAGRHPHHLFVKDANRFGDSLFEEIEATLVRGDEHSRSLALLGVAAAGFGSAD